MTKRDAMFRHIITACSLGLTLVPKITFAQDVTEIQKIASTSWANSQQLSVEYWHDGKAVLESGDTITSKIKLLQTEGKARGQYDIAKDLIQLFVNHEIATYSARKVLFFEIFDSTENRYRQFYSMPFATSKQYQKSKMFFELLVEGKMTVLCRETLEYRPDPNTFNIPRLLLVYHYFLLQEDGEVVDIKETKSIWKDLMNSKAEQVHKYAEENKLNFKEKYDLARIVAYYNSLF